MKLIDELRQLNQDSQSDQPVIKQLQTLINQECPEILTEIPKDVADDFRKYAKQHKTACVLKNDMQYVNAKTITVDDQLIPKLQIIIQQAHHTPEISVTMTRNNQIVLHYFDQNKNYFDIYIPQNFDQHPLTIDKPAHIYVYVRLSPKTMMTILQKQGFNVHVKHNANILLWENSDIELNVSWEEIK